jgi:PadR family transcriptional regulator, regulatory protein PadR
MAGSDLFTGTLDILVLKALVWGPLHGYAINKWIRERTNEVLQVNHGALYPALYRLEARGWLHEEWGVTERNREAKYYSLTPLGRRQLKAEVERWKTYTRAVNAALASTSA